MEIVSESYSITKSFPDSEKFGLASQMNRSAVSIPTNIAEGSSKSTDKHFKNYLQVSLGSAFEWETQLIVAHNQNFVSHDTYEKLQLKITELQKMISSLQSSLKS